VALGAPESLSEVQREVACAVCHGDWKRCKLVVCPYLRKVRRWFEEQKPLQSTELFGASPPTAFVGSWGYPRVLAGPMVPPAIDDASTMDAPETWLGLSVWDILRFRLSLVRGKASRRVQSAVEPDPLLRTIQEGAMAGRPVDTELRLDKRPYLEGPFMARSAPSGPSAVIRDLRLTENPAVPRRVDYVASDTDLLAVDGVKDLYEHGIAQSAITRVFSVGLLGLGKNRKLVPTEWSITAVDDILAKRLLEEVRGHPWVNEYRVFTHRALANAVTVLLMPTAWMFEALEAWNVEDGTMLPAADHEFFHGRKAYPEELAGGYHAARLPVLEYLSRERRQAGAVVFLEVFRDWIPLGVWRFREIARAALEGDAVHFASLEESLANLRKVLTLPMANWLARSKILAYARRQRRITEF